MANYSDEYVANLMKSEGDDSSKKYSLVGIQAYARPRPTGNAPKPNIRFLNNILRDASQHNAALLAREQRDARDRQQRFREREAGRVSPPKGFSENGKTTSRRRHRDDVDEERKSRKRRYEDEHEDGKSHSRRRSKSPKRKHRRREASTSSSDADHHERRSHKKKMRHREDERGRSGKYGDTGHPNDAHPRSRSRSASPRRKKKSERRGHTFSKEQVEDSDVESGAKRRERKKDEVQRKEHKKHRTSREQDSRANLSELDDQAERNEWKRERKLREAEAREQMTKSRSDREDDASQKSRRSRLNEEKNPKQTVKKASSTLKDNNARRVSNDSDDSLQDFVGPKAAFPTQKRGRGTFNASSSSMDAHFATNYDPSVDVQPDPDTQEDWDQAWEALKDRQKWHQQHADRLRQVGFTEAQIKTWEKGGEKDEDDVKWTKKGQSREWDRGKVFDVNGEPMPEPDWGRLKAS